MFMDNLWCFGICHGALGCLMVLWSVSWCCGCLMLLWDVPWSDVALGNQLANMAISYLFWFVFSLSFSRSIWLLSPNLSVDRHLFYSFNCVESIILLFYNIKHSTVFSTVCTMLQLVCCFKLFAILIHWCDVSLTNITVTCSQCPVEPSSIIIILSRHP